MSQRAAIIVNPSKLDLEELRTALPSIESSHGWEPTLVIETTPEDAGYGQAREALEQGVDLVIAAGGDGTVRLVIAALANTDTPLGILPAGTGNLLARNLDIEPLDRREALDVAFAGEDRRIDLAQAEVERPEGDKESYIFAVIAGIGLDAGMIEHTDDDLKKKIGWPAYIGGIAKWMIGSGAFRARYRVGEDRTWGTRASTIMVGNCGLLTGGIRLLPEAKLDDGVLDMVIMRPRGPIGWAMVGAGVVARGLAKQLGASGRRPREAGERKMRVLNYYQNGEFTFRVDSKPESFELDGDAAGEIVAAHVSVLSDAVTVRVPR
ncbi:MAG: diacylglycerol/lipid kinase family protein [Gulosibacter sp.]|uniref:diacylglycerol/lipid kinase family protein n=1 Tax=Gulosibacter sp. TaxID=2817531 RepID=UPI003F8F6F9F